MVKTPPAAQPREGRALRALGHVVRVLAGAGMAVAAASLLLSLCLIGWSVVMRYGFNAAPVWVDEVVGFLLVAIVMLALLIVPIMIFHHYQQKELEGRLT